MGNPIRTGLSQEASPVRYYQGCGMTAMSDAQQMSANTVLHSARVLAGYAASELFEGTGDLPQGLNPSAFGDWHNVLTQTLEELGTALSAHRPALFVDHVQWLHRVLQARGVEPAVLKAALDGLIRVLQAELAAEHSAPAVEVCLQARRELENMSQLPAAGLAADSVHGRLASHYLLALLEGDRQRAMQLVLDAATAGHAVPELYLEVLLPAQQETGRMWQQDEMNVAEGHFATSTTKSVMAQLSQRAPRKPPNGKTLLASTVTGNQHDVGLQAVAEFFEMDGWRVIPLGSDVPIRDLVEAVEFYQVDLLALSVALRTQLNTLKKTIQAVRRSPRGDQVKILVGGGGLAGAGDLAAEYGADAYAADPVEAVRLGNALVGL